MLPTLCRQPTSVAILLCLMLGAGATRDAVAQKTQSLAIKPGKAVNVRGKVTGHDYVDYLFEARAGQTISVAKTGSSFVFFNVLSPVSKLALFNSSLQERLSGRVVPDDGRYTVRVYQMGNAKSSNKTNAYGLRIRLGGKALAPLPGGRDAKIPGTPYHARTEVPCAIALDPETKRCEAFAIRRQGGAATIHFRYGRGFRSVLIVGGRVLGSDSTERRQPGERVTS